MKVVFYRVRRQGIGLCRHRPVPECLRCYIKILWPNDSAVLNKGFEEEGGVPELAKGLFLEKGPMRL